MVQLVDIGITPALGLSNEEVAEDDETKCQTCEQPASPNSPTCTFGGDLEHVRNGEEEDPAHNIVSHEAEGLGLGSEAHRRYLDGEGVHWGVGRDLSR